MEQLALHGPVKDNQAVVATTSYPFHLAPVVDKNHSNLSSPSKPIHLVLGQHRPSGKSREAGRPGNSEDRQPTQAALADNNPHDRSIGGGPVTRIAWDNIQRLHIRTSPLPPSKDTSTKYSSSQYPFPVHSMLYNLICDVPIISLPWLLGVLYLFG